MKKKGWFWHVHHDTLIEWSEDIDERIEYIKNHKPPNEIPLRLKLLKPVKGKIPSAAWEKAYVAWQKADAAWEKAYVARQKASAAWEKAYVAWQKADAARQKAYVAVQKAEAARQKAYVAWQKADAAREKAYVARQKAEAARQTNPTVLALHAKECPNCPRDGETIFP
jgi:hypothetical protein